MIYFNKNMFEKHLNSFKEFLVYILLKRLIPGSIIISIMSQLLYYDFILYKFTSENFIYRFLSSMVLMIIYGFIFSWICMCFYNQIKENIKNIKKYLLKYIIVEGILGFGLPISLIKYIFQVRLFAFNLGIFIESICIGLLLGIIYGFWSWGILKKEVQ